MMVRVGVFSIRATRGQSCGRKARFPRMLRAFRRTLDADLAEYGFARGWTPGSR